MSLVRTVVARNYIAGKEIVKSEVISDRNTTTGPVSEIELSGTARQIMFKRSASSGSSRIDDMELRRYRTGSSSELANYGTTPETAP